MRLAEQAAYGRAHVDSYVSLSGAAPSTIVDLALCSACHHIFQGVFMCHGLEGRLRIIIDPTQLGVETSLPDAAGSAPPAGHATAMQKLKPCVIPRTA